MWALIGFHIRRETIGLFINIFINVYVIENLKDGIGILTS